MDLTKLTDEELQQMEDEINEEQARRFVEGVKATGKKFLESETLMDFLRSRR